MKFFPKFSHFTFRSLFTTKYKRLPKDEGNDCPVFTNETDLASGPNYGAIKVNNMKSSKNRSLGKKIRKFCTKTLLFLADGARVLEPNPYFFEMASNNQLSPSTSFSSCEVRQSSYYGSTVYGIANIRY